MILKSMKYKNKPLDLINEYKDIHLDKLAYITPSKERAVKDNHTRYLSVGPRDKSQNSVRDIVVSARKMLYTSLAINDKDNEIENLKD